MVITKGRGIRACLNTDIKKWTSNSIKNKPKTREQILPGPSRNANRPSALGRYLSMDRQSDNKTDPRKSYSYGTISNRGTKHGSLNRQASKQNYAIIENRKNRPQPTKTDNPRIADQGCPPDGSRSQSEPNLHGDTVIKRKDGRAYTPRSDKEGGVDGEPRLAPAASRVVVPVGDASAGEGGPGRRRRGGAPGEGRREPSPRNPQHRVVPFLFRFLRLLRWWRSPPI